MKRTFARALCLALLLCLCQPTALALEAVRANRSAMWFVDGGNLILRGLPREMEGAAVSQIAARCGVPCVILRAMSDNADESGYEVLVVKKFSITEYVRTATAIVAKMIESL